MRMLKRVGIWIIATCGTVAIIFIIAIIARLIALSLIRMLS